MKNEDFTINELGDCYDLFLKKYPNLQIHLSIISENLKISKESHNLEIWYDKIIDYANYQSFDDDTEIEFQQLIKELNDALNMIYVFEYKL